MAEQFDLFAPSPAWPEGFRYERDVLTREHEQAVLAQIRDLPFKEFEFHGYVGKRRTVSFGASYDFASEQLREAEELPPFLLALRDVAARFSGIAAERLRQVLVTEYSEGVGIGWHRDKAVFGEVVGLSLLSACRFRLRRRRGTQWERVTLEAEPRSAYLLSGPARTEWEHSIPEVETRRYSVTYRALERATAAIRRGG